MIVDSWQKAIQLSTNDIYWQQIDVPNECSTRWSVAHWFNTNKNVVLYVKRWRENVISSTYYFVRLVQHYCIVAYKQKGYN